MATFVYLIGLMDHVTSKGNEAMQKYPEVSVHLGLYSLKVTLNRQSWSLVFYFLLTRTPESTWLGDVDNIEIMVCL